MSSRCPIVFATQRTSRAWLVARVRHSTDVAEHEAKRRKARARRRRPGSRRRSRGNLLRSGASTCPEHTRPRRCRPRRSCSWRRCCTTFGTGRLHIGRGRNRCAFHRGRRGHRRRSLRLRWVHTRRDRRGNGCVARNPRPLCSSYGNPRPRDTRRDHTRPRALPESTRQLHRKCGSLRARRCTRPVRKAYSARRVGILRGHRTFHRGHTCREAPPHMIRADPHRSSRRRIPRAVCRTS